MLTNRVTAALLTGAVLLVGAQTVAGSKTFLDLLTVRRSAGGGEALIQAGVSYDAAASWMLSNARGNGDVMIPAVQVTGPNSSNGLYAAFIEYTRLSQTAADSGSSPIRQWTFYRAATGTTAITNRPLWSINNASNAVWAVLNNGSLEMRSAGAGLKLKSGTNARKGSFTLSAGAATVANTSVAAGDVVLCMLRVASGAASPLAITLTAGVGFAAAGAATDNGTYDYVIVGEAP